MPHSTVFLATHAPDELLSKRLEVALTVCDQVDLLYWDRFGDAMHGAVPEGVHSDTVELAWHRDSVVLRIVDTVALVARVIPRLLKRPNPPTIIYVLGVDMLFPALAYHWLHRRVAIIWEVADLPGATYADSAVDRQLWHLLRRLVASVNLCVVTSPEYVLLMARRGVCFDRTLLLENMPRRSHITDTAAPRVPRRSRVMVGCFGLIPDATRISRLCDAAHRVHGVFAVIAGAGPGLADLEKHCRLMPETVLLGSYSYADIASLYASIDIAYVPYDPRSRNNQAALPNRLYDAVAFGIPVLVSPGTFLAEEVRRRGVGIVLKDDSLDELSSTLMRLASEGSNELSDLRESVRAYAGSRFWEDEQPLLAAALVRLLPN